MKNIEPYFFLILSIITILYNILIIYGLLLQKSKPWPQFAESKIAKIAYCVIVIGAFILIAYFKMAPILNKAN
jgi:uncharacterized membrane protein